jgi:hypothetical protein
VVNDGIRNIEAQEHGEEDDDVDGDLNQVKDPDKRIMI